MKEDFPVLKKDITYFDSACMTLRPEKVIEAVKEYYTDLSSCPGRSSHRLAEKTTERMEDTRGKIADFLDADREGIVFTSGTTESINTVAHGFPREKVFISDREHNSNILPWREDDVEIVSTEKGFDMQFLEENLEAGDLVSVLHKSNLDGMTLPVKEISELVEEREAYLLVDAAQSIGHMKVSVEELGPDFMAFSGHKMLGPSGTRILYASERVREDLEPLNRGGGAVESTSYTSSELREFLHGMEAGLPNAAGIIGLGAAVRYLQDFGVDKVEKREEKLSDRFYRGFEDLENVRNVGRKAPGVFSITIEGVSAHQAALMLDRKDVMVRSGKHCVHQWFDRNDEGALIRAPTHLYNSRQEVEKLLEELEKIAKLKG